MNNKFLIEIEENKFLYKNKNLFMIKTSKEKLFDLKDINKNLKNIDFLNFSKAKLLNSKEKVIWLTLSSLDDLNKFSEKITNDSKPRVLEFFDIIVFFKKGVKICIDCFKKRYFESLNSEVKFFLNRNKMKAYYNNFNEEECLNFIKLFNQNNNKYFDKNNNKFIDFKFVNHISCKKCYPKHKFPEEICVDNHNYDVNDTGYRVSNKLNIVDTIGRFTPVLEINDLTKKDRLNYPVFDSVSAIKYEEITYSFHGGKGYSNNQSKCSAIGEAYERYSSRLFGYEKLIKGSFNSFNYKINLFDLNQIEVPQELVKEDIKDKEIEWIKGKNLTTNQIFYLPANIIFFPYNNNEKLHITTQSTTGISAGVILEEAILQGLLEVIERDSYSLTYKASLNSSTIIVDDSKEIKELINNLKCQGIKLHLKNLKNDLGIYVVHCVSQDLKEKFPIYTHGSGASLDIYTAIKRAIAECIQLRVSQIILNEEQTNSEEDPYIKWGNGNRLYCGTLIGNEKDKKILTSSLSNKNTGNFKSDINFILDGLKKKNYEAYCVNLSRSDSPLKVVRVLIPGYQDIDNFKLRKTERLKKLLLNKNENEYEMFS